MHSKVIEEFLELVKISSPSGDEKEVREYIKDKLKDTPYAIHVDEVGNLIVDVEGEGDKRIMFDAHMDTVTPCENVNPVIKDGVIYSDGSTILGGDDKAGVAAMLTLLLKIKEENLKTKPLRFIFSVSEEVGLIGAKKLSSKYLDDIHVAYILDGEGNIGVYTDQTPFSAKGTLTFIGKEAHAGSEPEKGINALVVASKAIVKMPNGRINDHTTCNIGTVQGGKATNVVMPSVEMNFEARSFDLDELKELLEHVTSICEKVANEEGAGFKQNLHLGTSGYKLTHEEESVSLLKQACDTLGIACSSESCGGASNANVYRQQGVDALTLGIAMRDIHTLHEYIAIKDIEDSYKLLIQLVSI